MKNKEAAGDSLIFESSLFCKDVFIIQDRTCKTRYFAQGTHYEEFCDYWENSDSYIRSVNDSPNIVFIRARDIEGVYINPREVMDPESFWTCNGKNGRSKDAIMKKAEQISLVKNMLENSVRMDFLENDLELGEAVRSYFHNPIRVSCIGSFYVFQGDGRHRTLAAQSIDAYIPVLITDTYYKKQR